MLGYYNTSIQLLSLDMVKFGVDMTHYGTLDQLCEVMKGVKYPAEVGVAMCISGHAQYDIVYYILFFAQENEKYMKVIEKGIDLLQLNDVRYVIGG